MKIIGHRGARGLAPENTIASLRKALEHHVDMLEFDLRVTGDGVPVLHHNTKLVDANGQKLRIADHNYKQLKQHKPDLAAFEEVLVAIDQKVPLYIEIKPRVPVEPIIKIIKNYAGKERLLLGSKSQKTLLELRIALPEIPKIVIEPWSGVRAGRRARQLNTTLVSMNQLWLWSGFIKAVTHGGWELYAYSLNDPVKAKRWAKYGLTGVITDYPDRFEK